MPITKRTLAAAALMSALSASTASWSAECTAAHAVKTVQPGKLTVAIYDYPPFTVTAAADGNIGGIDTDIVKQVAKENCLEVAPMIVDPAATIQSVVTGKADVAIGSWDRTEARSKVLGISAPTYLDPMAFISKDGSDTINSLSGKRVGTVSGYLWVSELQKLLGTNLKLYPNGIALAQDLEAGRIDVALDGYASPAYAQKNGQLKGYQIKIAKPDPRVGASAKPAQSGVLYTKGNAELGQALDAGIRKMREDGTITKFVTDAGFDAGLADVGEPRLVK